MSQLTDMKSYIGTNEFSKDPHIYKAILAEFLGTLLLVLIGGFSCIDGWFPGYSPTVVQVALTFGFTVAIVVQAICHVSGGHINPAVSIAFLVSRHISLVRALLYILVQCVGAIAGAAILAGLTPSDYHGTLCSTKPNPAITDAQGYGIEVMITFLLVFTAYSVTDGNRTDLKGSGPIAIGLAVAIGVMSTVAATGASMNPARSFGPAIISGTWDSHWIYWVGPITGGIIASLLYTFLFRAPKPARESSSESRNLRDDHV